MKARSKSITVRPGGAVFLGLVLFLNGVAARGQSEPPNSRAPGAQGALLGITNSQFTINGRATFLLGISYYGALGAAEETIRHDLDAMQRHGFNWFRVWANWAAFSNDVAAVDIDGRAREPFLSKLKWLVSECHQRGMVVDVTLSRGNGATGPVRLQTHAAHRQAVETLIRALELWRNWYLDLSNERNVRDKRFTSFAELGDLRKLAREMAPNLLVTASQGGEITRAELRDYLEEARVDFITPHRPRDRGSPAQTGAKTLEYLRWMQALGRVAPVHYQEPFRRGYGRWEPLAADFVEDARQARENGAAGWCFHNGDTRGQREGRPRRSFDLREKGLFEQLDEEERKAVELLTVEGSRR